MKKKTTKDYSRPEPGTRFGRLVVVKSYLKQFSYSKKSVAECVCDCGTTLTTWVNALRKGQVSCGCYQRERVAEIMTTHGETRGARGGSKSKKYRLWNSIKRRCYNLNTADYKNYGARGITVCNAWRDSFPAFSAWCDANGFGPKMELDRKKNDQGYKPSNCRFVTKQENQNNKRTNRRLTHNGETLTIAQWSRKLGLKQGTLFQRLKRGWPLEEALETPLLAVTRAKAELVYVSPPAK